MRRLKKRGFLPPPLLISGMQFRFPAVLFGPAKSSDLILIADTAEIENNGEIVRQVLGVARALDVARARNPLTTIIVGPRPSQAEIADMMSVCRVLPLGAMSVEETDGLLANWLAILTPLGLVTSDNLVVDPLTELQTELAGLRDDIAALAPLANEGSGAVKSAINAIMTAELEQAWEDEA